MSGKQETRVDSRIGIVTVTYNSASVLEAFLRSIESQTLTNFILYVVDNASSDATCSILSDWVDPRFSLIANAENVGIAEGNNQGTRAALAEGCSFVLYLNNDIEFEPQTLGTLVSEMYALECDLLGPKIWYADGRHIWSAGGGFMPSKGYLGFHRGQDQIDSGQFEQAVQVQHTPACCLLVRVNVFDLIGMMDPKYFVYYDDVDFSYRADRAGLTMFYTPRAQILHKVSSLTGGARSTFTTWYNVRGHIYFMLKNLGVMRCLFYLPAWQIRLLYKWIWKQISFKDYVIRQRAFLEGVRVWLA